MIKWSETEMECMSEFWISDRLEVHMKYFRNLESSTGWNL